ncbi:MAG: tetratricopeptide repeat protein [Clostridium sp.]|nr:tetratricopeptide repeat protein [Clostridium sp.]
MNENEFTQIFAALQGVEEELENIGENQEKRQDCLKHLLELRKRMDHCVELWLRFEEKINEIQERFDFLLPDELPESFLQAYAKALPENMLTPVSLDRGVGQPLLLHFDNEACIRSFRRGLGFLELAMMDEAIEEFEAVIEHEPDLLLAHLCLGVAYAERKMADEAMRELRLVQALTGDPQTHAIVHNALGNVYADGEQYELALEEFSKVIELDAEFSVARFNLGAVYYNLKQYEKSILAFEEVKVDFPKDWEVYFYLGKGYKRLGDEEQSLANFLKASYLAPQEVSVLYELGAGYEALGETRKAMEYFYRAKRLSQFVEQEKERIT